MKEKVIRFNPLDKSLEFDEVSTDWKVVEEFYTATNKGALMTGLLWKDTPKNRALIEMIINRKKELLVVENRIRIEIQKLMNEKER